MNPTRAAAYLSLCVAIAAIAYLVFNLYQNVVLLRSWIDAFDGIDHPMLWEYGVPGAVATVGLITSLALFGARK